MGSTENLIIPGAVGEAITAFDEIADIIESFVFEIEDAGPDASNICVPIEDVHKLLRAYAKRGENLRSAAALMRRAENIMDGQQKSITALMADLADANHFGSHAVDVVIRFCGLDHRDYEAGMTLQKMEDALDCHLQEVEAQIERRATKAEAELARIMEWARGQQCGVCGNNVHPHEKCFECEGNGGRSGGVNNWTPEWIEVPA